MSRQNTTPTEKERLYESRKVYRHGRSCCHHFRCGEECRGQSAHGMRAGNQGSDDSGVHSRTAWNSGVDLRGRHYSNLVTRSAEASCQPAGGVRSAQRKNALMRDGNQNDRVDARNLAELLRTNHVHAVDHEKHGTRALKELGRSYLTLTKDSTRVMNRIKSVYRSWAIPCAGTSVYSRRQRAEWLAQLVEPGVRIRAEHLYEQLDSLQPVRQAARRELLRESRQLAAVKLLRQIPAIGPIRSALLVALLQTPHRFRTKRQLWAYSGFAVETYDSGEVPLCTRETTTQPRAHH